MMNAMMAGYFDTDGTFSLLHDKRGVDLRVILTSKRGDVLKRLSVYLYRIGILNYLRENGRRGGWDLTISNRSLGAFKEKIYPPHLRIRRKQFEEAYSAYRGGTRKSMESDLIPVGNVIKNLGFPEGGVKVKILREEGIDVWNWLKKPGNVPRDKLVRVLSYAEDGEIKEYLRSLVEANVTWVEVSEVRETRYTGKLYDFTTTTGNFIANGAVSHNCTYHRTDSTHVSNTGIEVAKEYITGELGEEYFKPRHWGGRREPTRP